MADAAEALHHTVRHQTYEWSSIADIIIYAIQPQQLAASRSTALPPTAVVPYPYVLFKQCNKSWGGDIIVRLRRASLPLPVLMTNIAPVPWRLAWCNGPQETTTVCAVGCLMSSTSMAIRSKSIPVPTNVSGSFVPANPGTVNTWLRNNDGCVSRVGRPLWCARVRVWRMWRMWRDGWVKPCSSRVTLRDSSVCTILACVFASCQCW